MRSMRKRKEGSRDRGTERAIALYHVVYGHEGFQEAAQTLFTLVRDAQSRFPNQRRLLFLDIEGHRNAQGGFDSDMVELQKDFLVGFLSRFLSEIRCPLTGLTVGKGQDNDVPHRLNICAPTEQGPRATE
jgi:hypothetical protein